MLLVNRNFSIAIGLVTLLLVLLLAGAALFGRSVQGQQVTKAGRAGDGADIRYKTKSTQHGRSTESTTLIKRPRERTEQTGSPGIAVLTQCDMKRRLTINDKTRRYLVTPFYKVESPTSANAPPATTSASVRSGGTVTSTFITTDLGERRQMFGYTASHLKITHSQESSPDACNQQKVHWEKEGWYIDYAQIGLDPKFVCSSDQPPSRPGCFDKFETKRLGITTAVFPLIETLTLYNAAGDPISTSTTEVVELSTDRLDPALFDIPPGYTEAKSQKELYQNAAAPPDDRESSKNHEHQQ